MQSGWLQSGFLIACIAFALLGDLLSKVWARYYLESGHPQPFLPGFLQFNLITNTGAAFGLGKGSGIIMLVLPLGLIAALSFWLWRKATGKSPGTNLERYGLAIIIGAACGNLLDRLLYGKVTDFLEFTFISFPVFNVADMLIDLGAGLILFAALTGMKPADKSRKEQL